MSKLYLTPVTRLGDLALERSFLTSATFENVTPGQDPTTGGSWEFGDQD